MIFKERDPRDADNRLMELNTLESIPDLSDRERKSLHEAKTTLETGMAGEDKAAYYLNSIARNHVRRHVMHDLRFSINGENVQIDHLFFNSAARFYIIESKNYNAKSIDVDKTGACQVHYSHKYTKAREAPHVQLARQARLFEMLLQQKEVHRYSAYYQISPRVAMPPTCRIDVAPRFRSTYMQISNIEDQYEHHLDHISTLDVFKIILRKFWFASDAFAAELIRLHIPPTIDCRSELRLGTRIALLEIEEFKLLVHNFTPDWQQFEFKEKPTLELRSVLYGLGYAAHRSGSRFVWKRSV